MIRRGHLRRYVASKGQEQAQPPPPCQPTLAQHRLVDPTVITHRLNVSPSFKPVKQKRRSFALERQKVINKEVDKLLQANTIREVEYPEWLANVVLVKKANDKWRFCIDFTDIKRACPKDSFPLPRINLIMDATVGHELLSFMDSFFGYN